MMLDNMVCLLRSESDRETFHTHTHTVFIIEKRKKTQNDIIPYRNSRMNITLS